LFFKLTSSHQHRRQPLSLGIQTDEGINQQVTRILGVTGVAVLKVDAGSAAAKAGLQSLQLSPRREIVVGDVIKAVNGIPLQSVAELDSRLDDFGVGARVTLDVWRQGKTIQVQATLQAERQAGELPVD
jgi:S1-C subfamily serine protease